jgi:hypothetical protein
MKIHPEGAELFHADRHDVTNLTVDFHILRTRLKAYDHELSIPDSGSSPCMNQSTGEANRSPESSIEVKNEWRYSYISAPTYAFLLRMSATFDVRSQVQIDWHVSHTHTHTHKVSSTSLLISLEMTPSSFSSWCTFDYMYTSQPANCFVMLGTSFLRQRQVDHQWCWLTAEYFYAASTKPQSLSARRTHILVNPRRLSSHDNVPTKPNFPLHYYISVWMSHVRGKI